MSVRQCTLAWGLLVLSVTSLAACVWAWGSPVSLEQLKQWQLMLATAYALHPLGVSAAYFAAFTLLTAVCLPGCGLLLLLGGATFGLVWGSVLALLASTVGATVTMLAARHALRPLVRRHLGQRLRPFLNSVSRDGGHYLLSLRLLPVIPFVPVNLMAGVTELRVSTFFIVSLIGMLPGTAVYVHAGRELAQVTSLQGLGSPGVLGALLLLGLLGLLPLATRHWTRPT